LTTPEFEWNAQKAVENLTNHGVAFDEAVTVFADPFANVFDDPDHSDDERRELIIGHSSRAASTGRQLHRTGATKSNHQRTASDSA
jgi:uncharacterized DUF497 family protein